MADIDATISIPVDSDEVVAAAKNVGGLTSEIRQLGSQMRGVDSIRMHSLRRETDSVRKNSLAAGAGIDVLRTVSPMSFGLIAGGAAGAAGAVMAIASKVADLAASLVTMGAKGTVAFGRFAISTGQFRENTLTTLSVLLKSKQVAQSVFDEAARFAAVTPFTTDQVVGGYKDLIARGFAVDELKRTFTAIGDLAAVNPGDTTIISRLSFVFGQIKSLGRLTGEDLNQITGAGISTDSIMNQIAQIMGGTKDEAMKAISAGKVTSDVAIQAVIQAIEKDFGGTMSALSQTLTGLWSTLVSKPAELITRALDPRTTGKFAGGLMSFYESVKSIVGEVGGMFFESDGTSLTKTGKEVVETINAIGNAMKESLAVSKAFFDGLLSGLAKNKDGTTGLRDALGNLDLKKMSEGAFKFGEDVSKIADAAGKLSSIIARLGENDTFIWAIGHAFTFAAFSIEMLIRGITWVTTTIAGLAGLISALGGMLASPFLSLLGLLVNIYDFIRKIVGAFGVGGIAGSLSGAINLPGGSSGGMIMPGAQLMPNFAPPTSMPIPSGASAPKEASSVTTNNMSISVSGGMMPEEIARLVRNEVKRAMESL
jgi:tape measure domain-containing protein